MFFFNRILKNLTYNADNIIRKSGFKTVKNTQKCLDKCWQYYFFVRLCFPCVKLKLNVGYYFHLQ